MKWLMLSIALVASTPAYAVKIIGAGAKASCGKWLSDREKKDHFDMGQWALGYLSGSAYYSDKDVLGKTDADGVSYWLDNYCRANPTALFDAAVDAFYEAHANKP